MSRSRDARRAPGGARQAVLVANGPGELYTWTLPVLRELRRRDPDARVAIALVPCQFASGGEADIARSFGADAVTTPGQYLRAAAAGRAPAALGGADAGFVLALGGNPALATALADRLGHPAFRYAFEPGFPRSLSRLFVHDERAARAARRRGAPPARVEAVGNLVADAVLHTLPTTDAGDPHVLLMAGSRDAFALHLIPFMIALADELAARYPGARFVWPVSNLLSPDTLAAGIAGRERATLGGAAGVRIPHPQHDRVRTPGGAEIEMVGEHERYAHMRAADLAVTIPGTNTLELGIAGVPSVVVLPMNRPELIPLEGVGHWLGLVPLVGRHLKRSAVRLFVETLERPVSLPNRFSGEPLMLELKGQLHPAGVATRAAELLDDPARRAAIRARLAATMPGGGAAARLLERIYDELGWAQLLRPPTDAAAPAPAARGTSGG